jgi:hypothetical protein
MEQPYIPYIPCTATVVSTSLSWQVASAHRPEKSL